MYNDKVAVVVGGGPAGCSTALFLARRGMRVKIMEQRQSETLDPGMAHPGHKGSRSYCMTLSSRSWTVLDSLGIRDKCASLYPFKGSYQNGVPGMSKLTEDDMNANPALRAFATDRIAFGWDMISNLRDCQGISWVDGMKLESIDFDARKATFSSTASQSAVTESYDLLVGADGLSSKVRDELEREGLVQTNITYDGPARYKCFSGLDIQTPGADQVGIAKDMNEPFSFISFFRKPGAPLIISFWVTAAGSVSGIITHWDDWANGPALLEAITTHHPLIPTAWAESIVRQVTSGDSPKPAAFGKIIKVSQLHGPFTVLVGDAGHAVTSGLGQGLNAALESTQILDQVLSCGMSIEALPVAFNALRLKDVHALQTMERWMAIIMNASLKADPKEGSDEKGIVIGPLDRFTANAFLLPAISLSFLLPKIIKSLKAPPHFLLLRDARVSYSTVLLFIFLTSTLVWAMALVAIVKALGFLSLFLASCI